MITTQNDPSAKLLKSYPPPFKGTWKTLPSQLLPDDVLQDSFNVSIREGKLRARCGLKQYTQYAFDNAIRGSFMFIDSNNIKSPLASSKTKLYKYLTTGWQDITGPVTLSATDPQIRMTSIQIGTHVYLLYTNGTDALKYSEEAVTLQDIAPHAGTIPVCKDICTSFSRIVGITPPYTVQWCDVLNNNYLSFTNWPALNQAILADTEDALVAVRSLGTLGIAVYKEGNIFVGIAQSGPQSQAFRFEHRGEYEGPAGINAIVSVNGTHCYMTPTGRIGVFDGSQHEWIADGLWPFLEALIDTAYASRITGCYSYKTNEITFYFPTVGSSGTNIALITLVLKYPLAGIQDTAYFYGQTDIDCTNALSVRLFNADTEPFVFGHYVTVTDHYTDFTLNKDTLSDNDIPFLCHFKTGLFRPPSEASGIYKPILEVYAERDEDKGLLELQAVTSSNLESDGVAAKAELIDLTTKPINEYVGYDKTSGSFLGVQAQWVATADFIYKGCDVFGRETA